MSKFRKLIIVIDLGHGGHDPGALGQNSNEKTNVLNVGLSLGRLLEKAGHTVIYTRKTDKFVSLSERANIANRNNADVFISLHNNSAASSKATGFETFIYNNTSNKNTVKLQNALHDEIVKGIGVVDRGKKSANFAVLRNTRMPALLIEYAFINNPSDESILINEVDKLAQLTANGLNVYAGGNVSKPSKPSTSKPKPKPSKPSKSKPKSKPKANLKVDGKWGKSTTRALQKALGTTVDGIISRQLRNDASTALYGNTVRFGYGGSPMIRALQRKIGSKADGLLGPSTVKALQKHLGTTQDSVLSRPSLVVKELQRRLNNGTI